MRIAHLSTALLLTLAIPALAEAHVHRGPTSPRTASTHKAAPKAAAPAVSGMSTERATQIQSALIEKGYLSGSPSGTWDAESQAAMAKLQADNGWQTKLVPDSRAIIKLGLGPRAEATETAPAGNLSEPATFPANR